MSHLDIQEIVKVIKGVLPDKGFIPLHEPSFAGNEWHYVKECLDTGWVSSVGKFVDQFEKALADFTGAKRAVAVVNGTAALHIALKVAGVVPGDEVLIPALTFIATANAVTYCNAVPHFVDSEKATLGMDPYKLFDYLNDITEVKDGHCYNKYTHRRIKAVVPMHTFGHPVDLDPLIQLSEKFHLELVEDAAESLGSYYKGKHTGTFGKVAALSFNGNKIITTGGGGAILTNDDKLADLAKHLTTTAKVPHQWEFEHDYIGYNYRMPNINAALGCAQLENIQEFIENKHSLTSEYTKVFSNYEGIEVFEEQNYAKSNYWLNALILDKKYADSRDELLKALNNNGIMARPFWKPMHMLDIYKEKPKMDLSVAEELSKRIINIPSSQNLGGKYE
jgi:perosamine synthetase